MGNKRITLLLMSLVLTMLAACGGAQPVAPAATTAPAAATAAPAAGGAKTYFLVPKNLGNPYFDTANNGAQEAAKELGVTVTYQGSATADATQQIQLLNSLLAQNVSGLAISANDSDALVPVGKQAIDAGIPVVTWDSAIAPGGRTVHINQAVAADIAAVQIKMASDLAGGEGKIAILSATSTAPNQNEWIALMKEEIKKPEYAKLELVETVYGDDEDTKSYTEAQGLMTKYPDLKVIIAPTTVGIAASARAVQDAQQGWHSVRHWSGHAQPDARVRQERRGPGICAVESVRPGLPGGPDPARYRERPDQGPARRFVQGRQAGRLHHRQGWRHSAWPADRSSIRTISTSSTSKTRSVVGCPLSVAVQLTMDNRQLTRKGGV